MKKIFNVLKTVIKKHGQNNTLFSGEGKPFDAASVSRFLQGKRSTIPSRFDELSKCLPLNLRVDFYISLIEDEMDNSQFWPEVVERLDAEQKIAFLVAIQQDAEKFKDESKNSASIQYNQLELDSDRLAA